MCGIAGMFQRGSINASFDIRYPVDFVEVALFPVSLGSNIRADFTITNIHYVSINGSYIKQPENICWNR